MSVTHAGYMRKLQHLINLLFILAVIAQISLVQLRAYCDLSHLATHSRVDHKVHIHQHHNATTGLSEMAKVSQLVHSHNEGESSSKCCNEVGPTDCQISSLFELDHFDSKLLKVHYDRTTLPIYSSVSRNLVINVKTQDPPNLIYHRTTVLII